MKAEKRACRRGLHRQAHVPPRQPERSPYNREERSLLEQAVHLAAVLEVATSVSTHPGLDNRPLVDSTTRQLLRAVALHTASATFFSCAVAAALPLSKFFANASAESLCPPSIRAISFTRAFVLTSPSRE